MVITLKANDILCYLDKLTTFAKFVKLILNKLKKKNCYKKYFQSLVITIRYVFLRNIKATFRQSG